MSLHYLTVQDMLWVSLQLTKKVQGFRFAELEEATFYQYGYGESTSLYPQAAKFLTGFIKKAPFDESNEAIALVGCLGFLKINGVELETADLAAWFRAIENGSAEALAVIEKDAHVDAHAHHGLVPDIRAGLGEILIRHETALQALVGASV